jgi:16S rRNA (cytosine1402-N4)-methyltransferase
MISNSPRETTNNTYHQPVMLRESLEGLAIQPNGIYVDLTFGGGGHSRAILNHLTTGKLFAFDQDADAAAVAATIQHPAFTFIQANARFLQRFLAFHQVKQIDGLLADLGVSSHQIDTAERGFSTRLAGPLDMRMDPNSSFTASQVVNAYTWEQLTHILRTYGELHAAPKIAKALLAARAKQPITTTQALKDIVLPFAPPRQRAKFLAQVFQALRMEVNDELGALQAWLEQSKQLLKPSGRLVVISYHSLEDRLVKRFIKTGNFEGDLPKDFYGNPLQPFVPVFKKVMVPSEEELATNPRARSAKLRVGERTSWTGSSLS